MMMMMMMMMMKSSLTFVSFDMLSRHTINRFYFKNFAFIFSPIRAIFT